MLLLSQSAWSSLSLLFTPWCRRSRRCGRCGRRSAASFSKDEEIKRNQNDNHKDCHHSNHSGAAATIAIITHSSILLRKFVVQTDWGSDLSFKGNLCSDCYHRLDICDK